MRLAKRASHIACCELASWLLSVIRKLPLELSTMVPVAPAVGVEVATRLG